ncbi:GTP-binding protein [Dokdonella sp.]|uniref:GTP-binding protein n=1 Tax=Dokdonella sp. TaxID=2291710 RepID=UPI0025C5A03F|nr:GTP-binding protein [Dokdonella sp.]
MLYSTGRKHQIVDVHDTKDGEGRPRPTTWSGNASAASPSERGGFHRVEGSPGQRDRHPGHVDFTIQVNRALRVLDGAVVVFDGVAGVEPQTETNWRLADQYNVPRLCYVNKMDRIGANFAHCVKGIRERLGANVLLCQVPLGSNDGFCGMADLVAGLGYIWISDDKDSKWESVPLEDRARLQVPSTVDNDWVDQLPSCARIFWNPRGPPTTSAFERLLETGEHDPVMLAKCIRKEIAIHGNSWCRYSAVRPIATRAFSSCSMA